MSKIDLYDPKWVDMVFADKNKAYGAYQLRKSVSQRNIKALVILLVAAFIGGGYLAYQTKENTKMNLPLKKHTLQRWNQLLWSKQRKNKLNERNSKKKEEPKKVEPEKVVPETRCYC